MRAWIAVAWITSGCCNLGSLGRISWSSPASSSSSTSSSDDDAGAAAESTGGGEAEAAAEATLASEPTPELGLLALELGTDVSIESSFTQCTDPDGVSIGVFGGIGLRPAGRWAGVLRGGALIGAGSRGFEDGFVRRQLWAGFGFRNQDRRIGYSITPFVTRSTYDDDEPAAIDYGGHSMTAPATIRWGGGLAFDMFGRADGAGLHATLRFAADSHGASGALTLGYAFAQ